jgi:DNA-binding phage protein
MPTLETDDPALLKRRLAQSFRQKMARDGTTVSSLARLIGTNRTAVRRILDAKNTSITLNTMTKAAHALGLRLVLETRQMSPEHLGEIAHQLANTKDETEADRLKRLMTEGFYGTLDAEEPA